MLETRTNKTQQQQKQKHRKTVIKMLTPRHVQSAAAADYGGKPAVNMNILLSVGAVLVINTTSDIAGLSNDLAGISY